MTGLPLPPSVIKGAPVGIHLEFEPVVLRYPDPKPVPQIPDLVLTLEGNPQNDPSAEPAVIQMLNGAITMGDEVFRWTDGKLFVTDNKVGGLCAGFNCFSWTSDMIELIGWGQAEQLGHGVRFSTMGGLSSPQFDTDLPPDDTLKAESDLADIATWSRFPDSSFYIRFQSEDGNRHANVTVQLTDVMAVRETTALQLIAIAMMFIGRALRAGAANSRG
jgi:hypothetical protein